MSKFKKWMENAIFNQIVSSHNLDKPEIKVFFSSKKNFDKNERVELSNLDPVLLDFVMNNLSLEEEKDIRISTTEYNNFENPNSTNHCVIVNSLKINNIRYLNKYFEIINLKLKDNGKFIGCFQSDSIRRAKIKNKYPKVLSSFISVFDFLFNRILPKLPLLKKLYFSITKGRIRILSRAETFGRLYSCGFEVVDHMVYNNLHYFKAQKKTNPSFDLNPTYGPLISLKRVGKNKELFKVYKLRTMHPYSEYLQEYVYNQNNLKEGGKFKDDFRISPIGRILRQFWIDEIPMLINVIKGDMKLVGVRPLSQHYFSLYNEELQNLRTEFKPGFIPPFYADNPKTLEEIMESEKKYLLVYKKNPIKTDLNYLIKSLKNVVFAGMRSF